MIPKKKGELLATNVFAYCVNMHDNNGNRPIIDEGLFKSSDLHDWAFEIGPNGYCPEQGYGEALWDTISTLKNGGVFDGNKYSQ